MKELVEEFEELLKSGGAYPFLESFEPVIQKLGKYTGKPYGWYLREFVSLPVLPIQNARREPMVVLKGFVSRRRTFHARA